MKIAAYVHGFFPALSAGSERMLLNILKQMQQRGHECIVICPNHVPEFEGVRQVDSNIASTIETVKWADIVITHHQWCGKAINITRDCHRQLVIIVHNTLNRELNINTKPNMRLIYNSDWVKEYHNYNKPGIVFHPFTPVEDYNVPAKDKRCITLINCTELKGAEQLRQIAAAMPERKFLAINGGYGAQLIKESENNIQCLPMQLKMKEVYRRTRILLMPSRYESYGMTAIEACCSGIPVIAAPTPGLLESLGDAGLFVGRDNIQGWADMINMLDDKEIYEQQSAKCKARAEYLDDTKHIDELEKWLMIPQKYIYY